MRRWQRRAAAIAITGTLVCLFATPAQATHVVCGDVITQNTTLDSDLLNCTSNGILIGAPGITLDLGGYLIDGPDPAPVSGTVRLPAGVHNPNSYGDVTVQNGQIREFATGLIASSRSSVGPAGGIVVRNLNIFSNLGIAAESATDFLIEGNSILSRVGAILLFDSSHVTVRDNAVDSPLRFGARIGVLTFSDSAHHNVVERNTLSHGDIALTGHDSVATRNVLAVDAGVVINGYQQLVSRNLMSPGSAGIFVSGAARVYKNDLVGVRGDGIQVQFGQSIVDHNTVTRATGNGITASWAGTVVAHNKADQNADLGIFATPDVVDGGGNKARGNGNPAQCAGVICK